MNSFGEDAQSLEQSITRGGEGWGNFHRLSPGPDGREEEETFAKTGFDDGMSQVVVGLFKSRLYHLHAANQAAGGDVADHVGMFALDVAKTVEEDRPERGGVPGQIRVEDFPDVGQGRGATDRI